jgi:hypothetical protein
VDVLSFCLSFGFSLCYNMPAMEDRREKIILLLSSLFLLLGLTKQSGIVLAPYHGEIVRILRQLFHCAEYLVMTVDNKMKLPRAAESFDPIAGKTQFQKNSYARELRAVGQALEAQHVFSLDLELNGGLYVVRGKVTAADYAQSSFSGFIQDFVSGVGSVLTGGPRPSIYEIDLSYQPEDIEELDSKGRSHRRNGDRNPDPYGLAQKLRGAGSFLDYRPEMTLAGISVEDRWVTIRYRTAEGRIEQAKQDVAYFYNYWVKMYLRRGLRHNLTLPDDSTVVVNWGLAEKQQNQSGS